MDGRRFLLMHITAHSGHHQASCAVEETLKRLDPSAAVVNVDAFQYTSRLVRWAISRFYVSLIRHQPDVWEYLYDNPIVHRRVQVLRALLHRYHAVKLQRLIDDVRPDVIACTQAYPCGVAADFKKHHRLGTPLVGILTDYAPHLYWFHDTVDAYVVPSEQIRRRFLTQGIQEEQVKTLGIPIDLRFLAPADRAATARQFGLNLEHPILLLMGGGGGFGQLRQIVLNLDKLPQAAQLIVLTGTNHSLLSWLTRQRFRHRVIVNPIPGQEAYNARFLLSHGAAMQAGSPETVRQTVRDLLENSEQLETLRRRSGDLAHPNAALDIARMLCRLADRHAGRAAPRRQAAVPPTVP